MLTSLRRLTGCCGRKARRSTGDQVTGEGGSTCPRCGWSCPTWTTAVTTTFMGWVVGEGEVRPDSPQVREQGEHEELVTCPSSVLRDVARIIVER